MNIRRYEFVIIMDHPPFIGDEIDEITLVIYKKKHLEKSN